MKKHILQKIILAFSVSFLLLGNLQSNLSQFPKISIDFASVLAAENKEIQKTKGKVSNISQKAKTIALTTKEQGLIFLKFSEDIRLQGFSSPKDLKVGEAIIVEYRVGNGENFVISLQKALVKLPVGTTKISTEKLAAILKEKTNNCVLIDARPKAKYAKGHIIGAISLPYAELKKVEEQGTALLERYKEKQLIFYCGGPTCTMSPKSAGLAVKWGHKNPMVYVGGLPSWTKAGYKVLPELRYLEEGNIVILDVRKPKQVTAGVLPNAYNIPLRELEDAEDILPSALNAPIYLYGNSDEDVIAGIKTLKNELGYKNVIGIYDALKIWKSAGKELQKRNINIADEEHPILWEKKLGEGEISIEDFNKSLKSDLIYVIDARTPAEYDSGHFPESVSIPLEQMQRRINEIPKDKFIVVHCKTGGRGEIGYHLLKKNGYAVKFLNAECECSLSGEYEIW